MNQGKTAGNFYYLWDDIFQPCDDDLLLSYPLTPGSLQIKRVGTVNCRGRFSPSSLLCLIPMQSLPNIP